MTEPTVNELDSARRAVIASCRHLSEAGLSPGSSGNVSLRVGDRLLVTPTGSALWRVAPEELSLVTLDGGHESGPKPTKELAMHLAVHRHRPDDVAIVHLHSPYATAVACLPPRDGHADLPPLTPYRVMRLGDVPVAGYGAPGSADLADAVDAVAGRGAVMLLANHGSLVAASDLNAALDLAEELETASRITLLLRGTAARELTPEQVSALRR